LLDKVGILLGISLGDKDGLVVGTFVGLIDGNSVGIIDGASVVGDVDGDPLSAVGVTEGLLLG